jgi:guanylate kinase
VKKRLIIVGKGGSGKDHLRRSLENCGFKYCVSHTTRPMREGEIDGKDYFFTKMEDLSDPENLSNSFYEWTIFNEWFYGTSLSEFKSSNLFIMTPSGISKLKKEDREESLIVFLDIEEHIRRKRLEARADADRVERRIRADDKDFSNFIDFDLSITNPNFSVKEISEILKIYDRNELH